jgi:hypothetical protein
MRRNGWMMMRPIFYLSDAEMFRSPGDENSGFANRCESWTNVSVMGICPKEA